ncbi:B-cell receptor CD22-like [Scomber scombrus]|uniref:B-cell receptor CD22-like n=1 Tax=Scomber scombrus TaxID=13677 RepID=UPI002DDC0A45|nr:B-cell receptor CD22-like [Scomber scombrus]
MEAELKCLSSCSPAGRISYVWFNNGEKMMNEETYLYSGQFNPGDNISCALKGHEDYRSPSVYAPKLPSVSVSPSGEIIEGRSVNLTCSSDANPAANYTWYKKNEDSPKASGQIFTITDVRPEHSGNYYCEAQNKIGSHNSTLHLIVVTDPGTAITIAVGVTAAVLLPIIILSVFLWMRKKSASNQSSEAEERPDDRERTQPEQDNLLYTSVQFSSNQADPLYSNIRSDQLHRHMEEQEVTEYATVNFNRAATAPRTRGPETGEDPAALYSTVNRTS